MALYTALSQFVAARQAEFDQISPARKRLLEQLNAFIVRQNSAGQPVRLVFVCTHNSRRSHMAELWAAVAAQVYGIDAATYSGGTESTAFNPRAVTAMQRAGFRIEKTSESANPIYHVRYGDDRPALVCFSKRYDQEPNPRKDFAAVMVCDEADAACPSVAGAAARFAIPFVDPKHADGTPAETSAYDERCAQIAREIAYVFSRAAG